MATLNCRMRAAEKRARQTFSEKRFLERGNEVAFQPGWTWESRFSGLKSNGRWALGTLTAERND
jgi:hypothetical protein